MFSLYLCDECDAYKLKPKSSLVVEKILGADADIIIEAMEKNKKNKKQTEAATRRHVNVNE